MRQVAGLLGFVFLLISSYQFLLATETGHPGQATGTTYGTVYGIVFVALMLFAAYGPDSIPEPLERSAEEILQQQVQAQNRDIRAKWIWKKLRFGLVAATALIILFSGVYAIMARTGGERYAAAMQNGTPEAIIEAAGMRCWTYRVWWDSRGLGRRFNSTHYVSADTTINVPGGRHTFKEGTFVFSPSGKGVEFYIESPPLDAGGPFFAVPIEMRGNFLRLIKPPCFFII